MVYANLKQYCFYHNNISIIDYVISLQVKDKQIKVVRNWLIHQLVWDIQIFPKFANFYWRFNQDFSKLATLLTIIQRTIGVELLVDDPGIIDEDTIIDEVGSNSEVSKVKT